MSKIIGLSVFLCLVSCGDNPANVSLGNIKRPAELLRYTVFATESEKYLSFPVLFDRRVIQTNGISEIIRRYYITDTTEMSSGKILREERRYGFMNGNIMSLELFNYYDDRQVGRMKVVYENKGEMNGFKEANIVRDSGAVTNREFLESGFQVHQLIQSRRRYTSYREKTSGTMLFFMRNKAYWGPLSVDSILHPSPHDRVILGSPIFPWKNYQVENKIKEKNAAKYVYHPYLKRIRRIVVEDFPFTTKRTFFYDNEGYCSGYSDSTFSSKKFLMRTDTYIKLNSRKLPVKITQKKETAFRKLGVTSIERFKYVY